MAELKAYLMDGDTMQRVLTRMAHEIMEQEDLRNVLLIGIRSRGVPLARRLAATIRRVEGVDIPVGELDITMYRDDMSRIPDRPAVQDSVIPGDITGKTIILVDDVLYTGRTVRAAMEALMDRGRPARIRLAALIDRGHRELPIRPDFVGKAGMKIWQVLPMGPTGYGESPYQSTSVYAGNPRLISLRLLREEGLVDFADSEEYVPGSEEKADFDAVAVNREALLRRCFAQSEDRLAGEVNAFVQQEPWV